ncbi:Bifunctional DNA primase/polymerase, N-terminal [Nocardiopsis flavescens]|uniref:Bifunctional DNA primase/polymerase, N-terminal n=1 Tax=Nocardiopsis flavescens TaxID=758803 RepID=A0A1M6QI09_9ACTN|nr:bifunctional DNA primase/polymerase [Nocardiopsis flavescens]SHK19899.1 Bifunctional DNA primase/polymerase, N-terminal [Nocardiopsis flavescens]
MSTDVLNTALTVAAAGVPVLPLSEGKVPFGNCRTCKRNACGGRPHMKDPGRCRCAAPCHGWAAATVDPAVLTSPDWAAAWHRAVAVAYHPAGADLTVVDLDNTDAVTWARDTLPRTRTVATTRGEHWIYRGTMQSANAVRPGVDIKSRMAYARWLGPGAGILVALPPAALALSGGEETTPARRPGGVVSSTTARSTWDRTVATGCRHTERYVRTGLDRGLALVRARTESGAASQAFGVARFLAGLHTLCPGPCGLDTIGTEIIDAAVSVGVPETYAQRAVARGFATGERAA